MELVFRRLVSTDLSAIQDLSDSMDISNDPKIGNITGSLLQDSMCTLFGAFKDDVLVGVGGLRDKGRNLAWIESIRVNGEYQRTGVGTGLFRHGEELARELGYLRAGFQTVTENAGSCRIGEELAFERKHEMTAFYARPENLPQSSAEHCRQAAASAEEALLALKRIPNGPRNEICIGWSYVPISADFFDSEPDMKFYVQDETVMLSTMTETLEQKRLRV